MSEQAVRVSLPILPARTDAGSPIQSRLWHSSGESSKPVKILSQHLYIEPISSCNLHCRMCYTNVVNGPSRRLLEAEPIVDFVLRYANVTAAPFSIYWCGTGEVMLHRSFPDMVNRIQAGAPQVEQIIQTNGTVKRLAEFQDLTRIDFRVSIDGVKPLHEWHRGPKTYDRTVAFCRDALDRGCRSMNIRCLVTLDNIVLLDEFAADLTAALGPRYTLSLTVPYANPALSRVRAASALINRNEIEDNRIITFEEAARICKERYQGRYTLAVDDEVDNYLSLSSGGVYTCCEGVVRIGDLADPIETLIERMAGSEAACRSCALFPCQ